MKREIIFVDFENIQNLNFKKRDGVDSHIILFVGSKQNSLNIETLINLMSASEFNIVKVEASTKNALDFTLSIEVGRFHEREEIDTKFIVVSKDRGFEAVKTYIKMSGREIELLSDIHPKKAKVVVPKIDEERGEFLISHFSRENFPRATRLETLKNQIASIFRSEQIKESEVDAIVKYLQSVHFLKVNDKKIIYSH